MKNQNWIETRRDCDIDDNGILVVKKITLELEKPKILGIEKKDLLDLVLKLIGLISIAIPILLFSFQQSAERKRQKALLQTDLYINTSAYLHKLSKTYTSRKEFEQDLNRIKYELYPKILLFHDTLVNSTLSQINYNMTLYLRISDFVLRMDSVLKQNELLFIRSFYKSDVEFGAGYVTDSLTIDILDNKWTAIFQEFGIFNEDVRADAWENLNSKKRNDIELDSVKEIRSGGHYERFYKDMTTIGFETKNNIISFKTLLWDIRTNEVRQNGIQWDVTTILNDNTISNARLTELKGELRMYLRYNERIISKLDTLFSSSNRYLNDE